MCVYKCIFMFSFSSFLHVFPTVFPTVFPIYVYTLWYKVGMLGKSQTRQLDHDHHVRCETQVVVFEPLDFP